MQILLPAALHLRAGTLNINNSSALGTVAGTFIINGGTVDNTSGGIITTLNYPQTWAGDFAFTGTNDLNLGTGNVSMSANRQVTVNGGTLTVGGKISGNTFSLTKSGAGALTLSGANTFTGGTTLSAGNLNINNSSALGTVAGTFTINGGTIDNTSGGAITTNNYPQTWTSDFTFTGTKDLNLGSGTVTMNNDIQITTDANTLTIGGTVTGNGYSLTKTGTASLIFGSHPITLQNLTISNGTFTSTSGTLNLSGNFSNNGTFTHNSGTVNFNGTSAQTIGGSSSSTFNTLKINNATGISLQVATTTGTLTIGDATSNSLFYDAGYQLTSSGTLNINSGTFKLGSSTATTFPLFASTNFDATYATVEYAATATQTIKGITYTNLTISGAGNNSKTADGDITVNRVLNLNSYNYSASQGCLEMSSHILTMGSSATTIGTGDVTGIVSRNSFALSTPYTFGNQSTLLNLISGTTLPSSVSFKIVLTPTHTWDSHAIDRYYDIIQTGGSPDLKQSLFFII